jgi:hypothetical protein
MSGCGGVGVNVGANAGCGGVGGGVNVNMNIPSVNVGANVGCGGVGVNAGCGGAGVNMNMGGNMNMGYQQPQVHMNMAPMNVHVGGPVYGGGVVVGGMGIGMAGMFMRPMVCGRPVPKIDPCAAIAVLILNIFWPGFGTMICGCVPHYGSIDCCGDCCCFYWLGYLHFMTCGILVGWILGIVLGCQLITVANMPIEQLGIISTPGVVMIR